MRFRVELVGLLSIGVLYIKYTFLLFIFLVKNVKQPLLYMYYLFFKKLEVMEGFIIRMKLYFSEIILIIVLFNSLSSNKFLNSFSIFYHRI